MNTSSQSILLVEDNPDDVFLMKRALKEAGINRPLNITCDGNEAIDYLSGQGSFNDREKYPLPSFVFLDLKLPYKSGFEVFRWIREHPELKDAVVIVLTSSPEPRDRQMAEQLKAYAYLVKPPSPAKLKELLCECE